MYFNSSAQVYGKPVKVIHAGEWHVSNSDEMILTILGSCVSVCIHDPVNRVSGMNHFMLPGHISDLDMSREKTARYGITAMKILLKNLTGLGADRSTMRAMIFGGGAMLTPPPGCTGLGEPLPNMNVRIAKLFLEMEDIRLDECDTGGTFSRKILMDVRSGKVFMRKKTRVEDLPETFLMDQVPVEAIRDRL
ncbi:MAG: chemotaxis protein CheD [Spirochaetes bacterium]|nr:chemotaxis protein CheD [Spirochaetota bacterium]